MMYVDVYFGPARAEMTYGDVCFGGDDGESDSGE